MFIKIFSTIFGPAVNPYVTGSSPVARAKISAGFRGFLFFSNLKLFPFLVPKYRQYLYYFYTRMHFWGIKTDFFVYTFLYTAEIQGFLTHCFFTTYRILVRVSVAQKSQISGALFFTDTQIFIQFCLYRINFLHFWDTFWDTCGVQVYIPKAPHRLFAGEGPFSWWALQDLNLWPLPCQGSALPLS